MRIGVTGGRGLLGRAVVERLIDGGHDPVVIDLVTDGSGVGGAEQRRADISLRSEAIAACVGLDGVIHTASLVDLHLGRPSRLYEVNVVGAQNIVEACRQNGIGRLVHMSSAEAISGDTPLRGVSEAEASYPVQHLTYYGVTKQGGEQAVLAAADETLATCVMRTYGLFGVGDNTVLPLYLSTLPGKSIVMMGDPAARTDVIFAPNLAHCLVLAVEQLEPDVDWSGTAFHVTDHETVNVQRFLSDMVAPLGYRVVDKARLPRSFAQAIATSYETRHRVTKRERFARPPLTKHKLRLALEDYWLDSVKARSVLGYEPPVSRAESVSVTQNWLLERRG